MQPEDETDDVELEPVDDSAPANVGVGSAYARTLRARSLKEATWAAGRPVPRSVRPKAPAGFGPDVTVERGDESSPLRPLGGVRGGDVRPGRCGQRRELERASNRDALARQLSQTTPDIPTPSAISCGLVLAGKNKDVDLA